MRSLIYLLLFLKSLKCKSTLVVCEGIPHLSRCCLALNSEQSDLEWLSLIDYVLLSLARLFFMEIVHENGERKKKMKLEIILLIIWLLLVLRLHFNHTHKFFFPLNWPSRKHSPYNSFDVELSISWFIFSYFCSLSCFRTRGPTRAKVNEMNY